MSEILEQLEVNQTFFYQFLLFGVFFLVLKELYLKPFQKLIEIEANLGQLRAQEEAAISSLKDQIKKDYLAAAHQLQEEKLKVESELKLQMSSVSDSLVQKILAES